MNELHKMDITEELERLFFHRELFLSTMNDKTSKGKKMGFIIQELGREANTLSAKVQDTQFVKWILALKESIERLKEQIQNIE